MNLILGCGALMPEILALRRANQLEDKLDVHALPAIYHNHPEKIIPALEKKLAMLPAHYDQVFIAYADCGTGGQLDSWIEARGYERLAGAHCYAFFAGLEAFEALSQDNLGTFYLTDYLALHFETLIIKGFKLDQNPELIAMMFSHYTKLVYLAQSDNDKLDGLARQAAQQLGDLDYERIFTGYGLLEPFVKNAGASFVPA